MVLDYNLSDQEIIESKAAGFHYKFWIPEFISIILGQSNKAEESLKLEAIYKEGIPIYKRPSGGESVVLSPNNFILSIKINSIKLPGSKKFFNWINDILIDVFREMGLEVSYKGISDLAIGDKKILGSSMYRRRDEMFYHAVINISEDPLIFEKYLKHPGREPDYRKGRSHRDFVTSIKMVKPDFNIRLFQEKLDKVLKKAQINPEMVL